MLALGSSDVCQSADQLLGDPLDVAVAQKWLSPGLGALATAQQQIVRTFAFDVERRRPAGIVNSAGQQMFVVKGPFEHRSGLDAGLFSNRLLLVGILIQIVFSWATLSFPLLQRVLQTGPVAPEVYGLAWLGIVLIFGIDYLRKCLVNQRQRR